MTFDKTEYDKKYNSKNIRNVTVSMQNSKYDELKNYCASLEVPINTFIKQAISEKMQRDSNVNW